MSYEQLAAVALRITQVSTRTGAPGNDLASLDTTEMPNGSLAVVADTSVVYVLNKLSTADPIAAAVVAAIGGGNWLALSIASDAPPMGTFLLALNPAVGTPALDILVQNQWAAMPTSVSALYSTTPQVAGALWSAVTTTGLITYNGPSGQPFMVYGSLSAQAGGSEAYAFSVSHSAAPILGTTTDSNFEARQEAVATQESNWSFLGGFSFNDGATIQGVVRNIDGTTDLTAVTRYQLMIVPAI